MLYPLSYSPITSYDTTSVNSPSIRSTSLFKPFSTEDTSIYNPRAYLSSDKRKPTLYKPSKPEKL